MFSDSHRGRAGLPCSQLHRSFSPFPLFSPAHFLPRPFSPLLLFPLSCFLLFLALLLTSAPSRAETLLLSGATVHTVSGDTLAPGEVLIREGRIAGVGANLPREAARVVELRGLHLYPGLIAAPTHLGLTEIDAVRATRDTTEVGEFTPDVRSWISVNPDSELIPVARANGITHALPAPMSGVVGGLSGLIALDGWTMEEMAVKKPVALHVFWPTMTLDPTPKEAVRDKSKWKSLEDQAKDRRVKLKALEDFFEEARAYARARETAELGGGSAPVPAWEAMLPVVRGEIPVMVHAAEVRQIKAAVQWAESNRLSIILAGGRDAWMAADTLAPRKVPVLFDATFDLPAREVEPHDVYFRAPAFLHKAGVTVGFTAGLEEMAAAHARNLPYHAAQAVAHGLPQEEALKGLTLYPARMLGVADRLGSIAAGREATLFAADGDILDIRANVKRMWIAGREVSLESRHTRLYEKYRQRPRPN
jgi:imidazolonepropionase-like amidohydrolase